MKNLRSNWKIWSLVVLGLISFSTSVWAAPVCFSDRISDSPLIIEFNIRDISMGLKTITVTEAINANVNVPVFTPGTTNSVRVSAERVDENAYFSVVLESANTQNEITICQHTEPGTGSGTPSCSVTDIDEGPPFTIEITIQDSESGLQNIAVTESENAIVNIPTFPIGILIPVIVEAAKVDPGGSFSITVEAENTGGSISSCGYTQPQEDPEPPTCHVSVQDPGPPAIIRFIVQDFDSGLSVINQLEASNASVSIPTFTPGTTDPIIVTAVQINPNMNIEIVLESVDQQDNATTCRYPDLNFLEMRPEFDAVGDDSNNFFNDFFKDMVIENGRDGADNRINDFSDFASEHFHHASGGLVSDPCFSLPSRTYMSAFTPGWTETEYEWQITLQMKPGADMFLSLISCVLQIGRNNVWNSAQETSIYRVPWAPNESIFSPRNSPCLTVKALPGPQASVGFPAEGFYLDARKLPGLDTLPLVNSLFACEALLEKGVLLALPNTGMSNASGQTMFELNRGDIIHVSLNIPFNNTADLYFGKDNLVIKYLGIVGTEYSTLE